MPEPVRHPPGDDAIRAAAERCALVLVPGRYNSGPEHWQSIWEREVPVWHRIEQRNWDDPDVLRWADSIGRVLAGTRKPAILAGHSLGALAACVAADRWPGRVAGLFLVAPAEPGRFDAEDEVPARRLPGRSLVVASQTDPFMSFERAQHWAGLWGSEVVDLGDAGHINAESGFGPWRYGRELVARLASRDSR